MFPCIEITRTLLRDFNGLIFGIGFSASFRFGQDPDASSHSKNNK